MSVRYCGLDLIMAQRLGATRLEIVGIVAAYTLKVAMCQRCLFHLVKSKHPDLHGISRHNSVGLEMGSTCPVAWSVQVNIPLLLPCHRYDIVHRLIYLHVRL